MTSATTELEPTGAPGAGEEELAAFRQRCRAFLAEHAVGLGDLGDHDPRGDRALAVARRFQGHLAEAGLAGLTYPRHLGGQGLTAAHEAAWREEAAGYPIMTEQLSISLGNCLPVLNDFGTDEQRRRHVPNLLSGREVWCQLFSEPGAGSDLAAVRARAELVDDHWVLNGQKVWTTLAHVCEFGILLARTDVDVPKHEGLSMFILDLRAPGVEVRPIHQIDGGMHFNEVFLTDVRLPADALVPPAGEGWSLAIRMLSHQRVARGTGQVGGVRTDRADRLIAEARARGVAGDPHLRQELARLYSAEVCHSVMAGRTRAALDGGTGATGSVAKLAGTRIAARWRDLSLRIVGPASVAWPTGSGEEHWAEEALWTLSLGIAGGTSEIQRTIIGERVLGLPREPAVDRDVPFRSLGGTG